jgi:phasin family protein
MTTLPEQFSAAGKSQVQAQLDFIESFGSRAFDGAARLIALNIGAGRAAVDSSSAAFRQLADARDPRDLLALAKGTQDISKLMDYGREWFSIVAEVQAGMFKVPALAAAPAAVTAPAPAPAPLDTRAPAAPARAEAAAAPAGETPEPAHAVKASKKPVVALAPEPQLVPAAAEKPIAKAAGKVAGKALAAKPSAAAVQPPAVAAQALPRVKPVEASPPPAVFQQDLLTPKRGKKR